MQQTQAEIDNAIREALNSTDPDVRLEGQVAQELRNAGFQITGIRIEIGPNAMITEIDIETPEAIIEVSNMSKGKSSQISTRIPVSQINPNGKPVILFAPNYKVTPERDIVRLGAYVARTPKKLFARLLALRGKQ